MIRMSFALLVTFGGVLAASAWWAHAEARRAPADPARVRTIHLEDRGAFRESPEQDPAPVREPAPPPPEPPAPRAPETRIPRPPVGPAVESAASDAAAAEQGPLASAGRPSDADATPGAGGPPAAERPPVAERPPAGEDPPAAGSPSGEATVVASAADASRWGTLIRRLLVVYERIGATE